MKTCKDDEKLAKIQDRMKDAVAATAAKIVQAKADAETLRTQLQQLKAQQKQLTNAKPKDPTAINAKTVEVTAKQKAFDDKQSEVYQLPEQVKNKCWNMIAGWVKC